MDNKLVCLADYLTYEEGVLLFNYLEEAGIPVLVKSSGPPSIPFGEGLYFQLLVAENLLPEAEAIVENTRQEISLLKEKVTCPRCRSEAVFPVKSLPFWQKLYYAGTNVFRCEKCLKKFSK